MLREHGLPEGLLPDGMTVADVSPDGAFEVSYPRASERTIGGYRVRFGRRITGRLVAGRVEELQGVDAWKLVWIRVRTIVAGPRGIAFTVGPVVVSLSAGEFA